jgi:sterol desaturase/sphingolipid hydroxylase (fatty acid hydroxylase superfamily)
MFGPDSPIAVVAYQALRFLNPSESYCLVYLMGGLAFALAVMLWRRRGRRTLKPEPLLRLLGSRKLWLHGSTRLDAELYLLHGVLIMVAYGLLQGSSELWRAGAGAALTAAFGPSPGIAAPRLLVCALTTGGQVLALELGYWALHYAFHKVPALWELHKVHHSAEVMTPLTEWRQHPIEFVAFGNVLTLATGGAYGAFGWLFGPGAQPFTLFQVNILLVLHFATFHHLRHSGVWIAARGWLGRVVHSPAHHQIHHSTDPRHFDCNLGYALSVWDWAFGTLVIPERRGRVRLGVEGEAPYRGLADSLVRPLVSGARKLAPQAS